MRTRPPSFRSSRQTVPANRRPRRFPPGCAPLRAQPLSAPSVDPLALAPVSSAARRRTGRAALSGRDRALALRAFLDPRPVRFYPARGVRYESQLAPPPHLTGLRIAALDSLSESNAELPPVVVASATAIMERIPDPALRPHGFTI